MPKKEEQEEKKIDESSFKAKWKKFHMRFKTDKQFNAGIKLLAYTIFLVGGFFILSAIAASNTSKYTNLNQTTELEPTVPVIKDESTNKSYAEILTDFSNEDKSLTIKANGGNNYLIEETYEDKVITGSLETEESIIKYVIRNHNIYELKMGEEKENQTLLDAYEIDFIDFPKLISIISNLSSIKKIDGDITNYIYNDVVINNNNNNTYQSITVSVKDSKITTITAINQNRTIELITK